MNRRRTLILILTAVLMAGTAAAQSWQRIFYSNEESRGQSALLTPNGDVLCTGWQAPGTAVLRRLSADGGLLWTKNLPVDGEFSKSLKIISFRTGQYAVLAGDYLMVVDEQGELVWQRPLPSDYRGITASGDGGLAIAGNAEYDVRAAKIDSLGMPLWSRNYFQGFDYDGGWSIERMSDGGYIIAGYGYNGPFTDLLALRIDSLGSPLWQNYYGSDIYDFASTCLPLADGSLMLLGDRGAGQAILAYRLDGDGNVLQNTEIALSETTQFTDAALDGQGNIIITGAAGPGDGQAMILKIDAAANLLANYTFGMTEESSGFGITPLPDGGYLLSGSVMINGKEQWLLIRTDSNGQAPASGLSLQAFFDENENCQLENGETALQDWAVEISGGDSFLISPEDTSDLFISLPPGNYQAAFVPPNDYWSVCDSTFAFTIQDNADTSSLSFLSPPAYDCPRLEVSLSTPFLRRCFENTYYVQVCNTGPATAGNAILEVELAPFLDYNSSSLPVSSQFGQLLTFQLGDILLQDCVQFQFDVTPNCDSTELGQTLCIEARAFPDTICSPVFNWSGASVNISGACQGDSVRFSIENVGTAPMESPLEYIVVEDDVILLQGSFGLGSGQSQPVVLPASGATYRLEAQQEANHPGASAPSLAIEGCGGLNSTGFVNYFALDDGDFFKDIDCQELIGSWDPNDKRGFPRGYREERFIEAGQEIEYHIRFQNTGTDTAFRVVILDTLSQWLDISSIQTGAASHPYSFEILPGRRLRFTFNDILLPDSTTNEPASHGFVRFRIAQEKEVPLGTRIDNRAAIYFDYNEPVITNTTFHTIGANFVLSSIRPDPESRYSCRIYPNPFRASCTIEVETPSSRQNIDLLIYNARGQLVRAERYAGPRFTFERKQLPPGLYFYQLRQGAEAINTGKLLIQ